MKSMIPKFSIVLSLALMHSIFMPSSADALPLPSNLIPLNSKAGIELLNLSTPNLQEDYWRLSQYFVTEKGLSYCAPASIVMVLNAMGIKPKMSPSHYPYPLFNQDNLLYNNQILNNNIYPALINHQGLTLGQAAFIMQQYTHDTKVKYGSEIASLDDFKNYMTDAISKGYVIVNFFRKDLNEVGGGHFSPVAAYNYKSDRFLILDVARYKYPAVWVKSEDLFTAIQGIDSASQKSRGLLIVKDQ